MRHSDYRTLVNMGRKAGLRTTELYGAIASRPPEGSDQTSGRSDSNGFVSSLDVNGHVVYRPAGAVNRG